MRKLNIVNAAIEYIEAHLDENPDLDVVAGAVHYSKYHLHRVFTDTVGMTIHDYAQRRRLTEAAKLLVFSTRPILDIALRAGHGSQQAFSTVFKSMYKLSPNRFREQEAYYALQLRFRFDGQSAPAADKPFAAREIRFAAEEDIPAWMELVRLVIDGFPHLQEAAHEAALRRAIAERRALIMWDGAQAAGIMMLRHSTGSIDFLGVHPLLRKQGVARALLDRALGELLRHGSVSITTFREGDRADTGHRVALRELGFAEGELLTEFGYPTQRMLLPNTRRKRRA